MVGCGNICLFQVGGIKEDDTQDSGSVPRWELLMGDHPHRCAAGRHCMLLSLKVFLVYVPGIHVWRGSYCTIQYPLEAMIGRCSVEIALVL